MTRRPPLSPCWLLALAILSSPLAGQGSRMPLRRPPLAASADTNDAAAYLALGGRDLEADPKRAMTAYEWALRLDPASADALYGRSVALLIDDNALFNIMMKGPRDEKEAARLRLVDSLRIRAEMLDPFLDPKLDRALDAKARRSTSGYREVDIEASRDYESGRGQSDYQRGLSEWVLGFHRSALRWFESSLDKTRNKAPIHALRGRIFQGQGMSDSALASLRLAVKEYRKADDSSFVFFYEPKSRYLYQIGWVLEALGKAIEAKEVYGQALIEDLSFYPAHQRVALVSLAAGDTATALAEFDLASQIGGHDAVLRVQYAYALAGSRRLAEASDQIQRVIAQEPDDADPHLMLARLYETTDMGDLAVTNYKAFLDRSPRTDLQRGYADERVRALSNTVAKSPGTP